VVNYKIYNYNFIRSVDILRLKSWIFVVADLSIFIAYDRCCILCVSDLALLRFSVSVIRSIVYQTKIFLYCKRLVVFHLSYIFFSKGGEIVVLNST
jgi:hypothetical protein